MPPLAEEIFEKYPFLSLVTYGGAEYVGIDAPATVSASYTITLPTAVAGAADYALTTTDAAGNTQWVATSTFGISTGKAIAMAIVFG